MAPWLADWAIPIRLAAGSIASARLVKVRLPVTVTSALKIKWSVASAATAPEAGTARSRRTLAKLASPKESWTAPGAADSNT